MPTAERKSQPVAMPEFVGLAEHKRHDWVVDIPISVTIEEVMDPSYWAHVAAQMEPLDHIEVRADDGSWVAELIVRMCEKNYAHVVLKQLTKLDAPTEAPQSSTKHKVEWKGPALRWSVIRLADSQIIHSGDKSRDFAYAWMQEHEKAMNR